MAYKMEKEREIFRRLETEDMMSPAQQADYCLRHGENGEMCIRDRPRQVYRMDADIGCRPFQADVRGVIFLQEADGLFHQLFLLAKGGRSAFQKFAAGKVQLLKKAVQGIRAGDEPDQLAASGN